MKVSNFSNPLVSVIIPTYNKSYLLKYTVESVINQSYPNIEIIVIDDDSIDDTTKLVKKYKGKIKYIKQKKRGGTGARNTGIKIASGKYLNFLDHDDLFLPDKIEKQVKVLESKSNIGFVHCRYFFIDETGKRLAKVFILPERNIFKKLIAGCFIWSGGPLIRKSCIEKVGLFDESIWSSDWDMWLRIVQADYKITCVQEPLGAYRIHHDSTMLNVEKTENDDIKILDKVFYNQNTPSKILSFKNEAYARWRLWLSCRYFAINSIENGKRNLQQAIDIYPGLIQKKVNFLRRISDEAVDFRVDDPTGFIDNVFNNLPENAELIYRNNSHLLSNIYLRMALRYYGCSEIEKAKLLIIKSFESDPLVINDPSEFIFCMLLYSMRYPMEPFDYVSIVFSNLPEQVKILKKYKRKVISHINIAKAYENYAVGNFKQFYNHILNGMMNIPSWKFLFETWRHYS